MGWARVKPALRVLSVSGGFAFLLGGGWLPFLNAHGIHFWISFYSHTGPVDAHTHQSSGWAFPASSSDHQSAIWTINPYLYPLGNFPS